MRNLFTLNFIATLFLIILTSGRVQAQSWTLEGPDDSNQPAFCIPYIASGLASDRAGSFFVACNSEFQKFAVRKWNGSWSAVGSPGISSGFFQHLDLAARQGTPYVVYKDFSISRRVRVRWFNGTTWSDLGNPVSPGVGDYSRIVVDELGAPVVAYADSSAGGAVTVKRWDGAAWQLVGSANFTPSYVSSLRLAVSSRNGLFVLVQHTAGGNSKEVFRFNGTSWVSLGNSAPTSSDMNEMDLAIGAGDTAYVAYTDFLNNSRAAVRKFNGTSWVQVGSTGLSPQQASSLQLEVDSVRGAYLQCLSTPGGVLRTSYFPMIRHFNGSSWGIVGADTFIVRRRAAILTSLELDTARAPHVLYGESAYSSKLQVRRFSGTGWSVLGTSEGLSQGPSQRAKLLSTPDGTTAYCMGSVDDFPNTSTGSIFRYDKSGWTRVGQSGVSGWNGSVLDMAIHPNGMPWIAVRDTADTRLFSVWRYTGTAWVNTGLSDTAAYSSMSLAIDGSGNVFAACNHSRTTFLRGGAKILKYTGGSGWTAISPARNLDPSSTFDYVVLRTSSTGEPYVLAGGYYANSPFYLYYFDVYRYTAGNWVQLGAHINSGNGALDDGDPDLALDSLDIPYIVYSNAPTGAIKLSKYNSASNNWDDLTAATGLLNCRTPRIQFAPDGRLFLTYKDFSVHSMGRLTVRQLAGTTFAPVGNTSFSSTISREPGLAILGNRFLSTFTDGAIFAYKYDCASPASISRQPADTFVCSGSSAKLHLSATGATAYRWQFDTGTGWKNVPASGVFAGVFTDTLTMNAVSPAMHGIRFRCVVTNACAGSLISDVATMLVDTPGQAAPVVSIAASPGSSCAGQPVTFTATALNAGVRFSYEWQINGVPVSGAAGSSYTTSALNNGDIVTATLARSSACGLPPVIDTSNALTVAVTTTSPATVSIAANPGTAVGAGQPVTFIATVSNGGTAPRYQWLRNGSNISGETRSTYTSSALSDGDVIEVRVTRADTCAGTAGVTSNKLTMQIAASVNAYGGSFSFSCYPQPARHTVNLTSTGGSTAGDYTLSLYAVSGQLMLRQIVALPGGPWRLQLRIPETVSPGIYRLSLQGAANSAAATVVLTR